MGKDMPSSDIQLLTLVAFFADALGWDVGVATDEVEAQAAAQAWLVLHSYDGSGDTLVLTLPVEAAQQFRARFGRAPKPTDLAWAKVVTQHTFDRVTSRMGLRAGNRHEPNRLSTAHGLDPSELDVSGTSLHDYGRSRD